MSQKILLGRIVDWQLIAVRGFIALVVLVMLGVIKHLLNVSWITYVIGLAAFTVLGYGLCMWLKRRTSRSSSSKEIETVDPAEDEREPPGGLSNTEQTKVAHSDPGPTAVLSFQPRAGDQGSASPPSPVITPHPASSERIVFERHWKMAVIEAAPLVLLSLGIIYWMFAFGKGTAFSPIQLTLIVMCIILLICYVIRRSIYSYRHSRVIIEGNRLIVEAPHSIRFWFLGGPLELDIGDISTVNLGKATPLEMLLFKKVQTVTIDTAAREDRQAHNLKHVINAREVGKAIFARKHELMRTWIV